MIMTGRIIDPVIRGISVKLIGPSLLASTVIYVWNSYLSAALFNYPQEKLGRRRRVIFKEELSKLGE